VRGAPLPAAAKEGDYGPSQACGRTDVCPSLHWTIIELMKLNVECYSGRKAEERPIRFWLEGRQYQVEAVLEQWYDPESISYKVQADDGNLYILRHQTSFPDGAWDLVSFRQSGKEWRHGKTSTKAYGLSGIRCGWILAQPELVRRMWEIVDFTYGSPVHPAERLAVIALDHLDRVRSRAQALLETNRRW
jgi:hypothetical protein